MSALIPRLLGDTGDWIELELPSRAGHMIRVEDLLTEQEYTVRADHLRQGLAVEAQDRSPPGNAALVGPRRPDQRRSVPDRAGAGHPMRRVGRMKGHSTLGPCSRFS